MWYAILCPPSPRSPVDLEPELRAQHQHWHIPRPGSGLVGDWCSLDSGFMLFGEAAYLPQGAPRLFLAEPSGQSRRVESAPLRHQYIHTETAYFTQCRLLRELRSTDCRLTNQERVWLDARNGEALSGNSGSGCRYLLEVSGPRTITIGHLQSSLMLYGAMMSVTFASAALTLTGRCLQSQLSGQFYHCRWNQVWHTGSWLNLQVRYSSFSHARATEVLAHAEISHTNLYQSILSFAAGSSVHFDQCNFYGCSLLLESGAVATFTNCRWWGEAPPPEGYVVNHNAELVLRNSQRPGVRLIV